MKGNNKSELYYKRGVGDISGITNIEYSERYPNGISHGPHFFIYIVKTYSIDDINGEGYNNYSFQILPDMSDEEFEKNYLDGVSRIGLNFSNFSQDILRLAEDIDSKD